MERNDAYFTSNGAAKKIISHLTHITSSGVSTSDIFEDWLAITKASLEMLPEHARSVIETGKLASDPPEIAQVLTRIWQRYDYAKYAKHFVAAYAALLEGAADGAMLGEYLDIVGDAYMAWNQGNKHTGQYFTPYSLARACAEMTIQDGEALVQEHLKTAVSQSILATSALLTSSLITDPAEARKWYIERVLPPAMEYYEPVTVNDPACGSGVMLLAAATCFPSWMTQLGLVNFSGQDIDFTCVQMAKINLMLYGLNGNGAKLNLAMAGHRTEKIIQAAPEIRQPAATIDLGKAKQISFLEVDG